MSLRSGRNVPDLADLEGQTLHGLGLFYFFKENITSLHSFITGKKRNVLLYIEPRTRICY